MCPFCLDLFPPSSSLNIRTAHTWKHMLTTIPPGLLTHFYPAIQRTESLSCLSDLFMGFLYCSSLTYTLTNIKPGSIFQVLGLFSVMDNRARRSLWWKRRWKYEIGTGPYWILKLCKTLGLHLKISVQHDYKCPLERTLQLNWNMGGTLGQISKNKWALKMLCT